MTSIASGTAGGSSALQLDTGADPVGDAVIDIATRCTDCIGLQPQPSAFDGPTGSVALGDTTYDVKDGRVSVGGKEIGSCDDAGNLKDVAGANFWAWLSDGTRVGNLPSGTVSFGQTDYNVRNGRVFVDNADVGSLDKSGHFEVTADNRKYSGNLAELTGAAMKGHLGDNHVSSNPGAKWTVTG